MVHEVQYGLRKRMSFSRIDEVLEMPDLIEVQKNSYRRFAEHDLREVLNDFSPITDFSNNLILEFVDYYIDFDNPKHTIEECKAYDTTYSAPLRVMVRLINKASGEIKQQEVFMGDFPIMTPQGTFIINGAERVIVSQLVRSPGVYFSHSFDTMGKSLYSAQVIPNRGSWLEYETDKNEVMFAKLNRQSKVPVTVLLRALGIGTNAEIIAKFGEDERLLATLNKDVTESIGGALLEIYRRTKPDEAATEDAGRTLLNNLYFDQRYDLAHVGRYKFNKKLGLHNRLSGFTSAETVTDKNTGEILVDEGKMITPEIALAIQNSGIDGIYVLDNSGERVRVVGNSFVDASIYLDFDPKEIGIDDLVHYPTLMNVLGDCKDMNLQDKKDYLKKQVYDLVPRRILDDDIYASISYLMGLNHEIGKIDDIDHLGNRRVRSVGELLQNQIRQGFGRLERTIRERMSSHDLDAVMPTNLINTRPVMSTIREFFGSSQLSQFMDQTNPLAEITSKRRLSALGPGGLNRDRATFDVRDVHYSHYGRMCPIETPEGPNIGLINSLSSYARINKYGFIETPYRKVDHEKHTITEEVFYMSADEEDDLFVAQANEPLVRDANGRLWFEKKRVIARYRDQILEVDTAQIQYMDVSPKQLVSVATAMIPFLENDDANRALMGSNMQRQAVPLLVTEAPIIGTGMEFKAAHDSGVVVLARAAGEVVYTSANRIDIKEENGVIRTYSLMKFRHSNQGTCINQKPLVVLGDKVEAGQCIADGASTDHGEIALGRNILIGFMPWEGYNYEDAILISEELVRDDVFTSIHIEKYEIGTRDTKLGKEEITAEVTNVGEEALKHLDAQGIIRIGAEVRSGDILVGKVTPKGESELSPEEKLLRAIFGEKAKEVRDTSLRVPHGEDGIVVDVKIFTRENKDELPPGVNELVRVYVAQKRKISVGDKMAGRHGNKGVISRILPVEDMPFLPDGTPLQIVLNPLGVPSRMNIGQVLELHLGKAAHRLGWHIATPVFDGATEEDIEVLLDKAGFDSDGKTMLYDGRSGEPFESRISVGYMYYLKLAHLVDDKIHARSTGPYSLITQQPLGGKAQFGGQRFGEMEVWALEAYGAANTLQEILTVKSDDVAGRSNAYKAIIKGENVPAPGVPESFKVLIKELQSLGLDVRVLSEENEEVHIEDVVSSYDEIHGMPSVVPPEDERGTFEQSSERFTDDFGDFEDDDETDDFESDFLVGDVAEFSGDNLKDE
ncbi:MAG: DNA-directed RNA polymerase subunit beta [Clostridiales bacterium]|nr:DNA-directed RNA polymerase subunit beta [Clostridiales bacterium]